MARMVDAGAILEPTLRLGLLVRRFVFFVMVRLENDERASAAMPFCLGLGVRDLKVYLCVGASSALDSTWGDAGAMSTDASGSGTWHGGASF